MADNVAVSAGSGTTLGTDETTINGTAVHVQRVTTGAAPSLSVGTAAITSTATQIFSANYERKGFAIQAVSGTVYLGGSGVTSSTGFPVATGQTFSSSTFLGALYAITASGAVEIRYWEES